MTTIERAAAHRARATELAKLIESCPSATPRDIAYVSRLLTLRDALEWEDQDARQALGVRKALKLFWRFVVEPGAAVSVADFERTTISGDLAP